VTTSVQSVAAIDCPLDEVDREADVVLAWLIRRGIVELEPRDLPGWKAAHHAGLNTSAALADSTVANPHGMVRTRN
jgi:hypothetical protein